MKKIIILNKKEGKTPLDALENFRRKNPNYSNLPMTYAGRLDPMASGILLILAGAETKNKEKYLSLEKEYQFEILFGFKTDTYDILGKILNIYESRIDKFKLRDVEKKIKKELKNFLGEIMQKYPIYSSKTVKGKPLFYYARKNEDVDIPEKKVLIKRFRLENIKTIDGGKLLGMVEKRIKKIKGDFRQNEILEIWKKELLKYKNKNFLIGKFNIKCSSGTYVRGIANSLGEKMNVPALAFSIERTKIGKFKKH